MIQRRKSFDEVRQFWIFFSQYVKDRIVHSGERFEKFKDVIVAFLVVKRGKYSQSFLNTSFFLLVCATLVAGPAVIENNPFLGDYADASEQEASANVLATDIYDLPFQTEFSQKPRAAVEDYTVKKGETLDGIAKKFDVDADSIKWATNLTSDKIKPGDKLKVPPVSGVVHAVKPGESIYTIAKRYNTSSQAIVNYPFNDFEDLDTFALTPGQTLIVPDGVPPRAKPPIRRLPSNIAAGQPGSGQFMWPTSGGISQYPIWNHMALDISNRGLPPVMAADTGTVTYAGCIGGGYGCHVIIDHGNGFQTLYAHLSRIDVGPGQGVGKGQGIGKMGSTGRSTGPHLHFEVRKGGALQNPLGYLQ